MFLARKKVFRDCVEMDFFQFSNPTRIQTTHWPNWTLIEITLLLYDNNRIKAINCFICVCVSLITFYNNFCSTDWFNFSNFVKFIVISLKLQLNTKQRTQSGDSLFFETHTSTAFCYYPVNTKISCAYFRVNN